MEQTIKEKFEARGGRVIPGNEARKQFKNDQKDKKQEVDSTIPCGFKLTDSGVYVVSDDSQPDLFICSPLRVLAHTRADDSTNWGKLLEWRDYDQTAHAWAMPMEELAGDSREWLKRLMSEGLRVGSSRKAKEKLSDYIQSSNPKARARCVTRPGWHGAAYVDAVAAIGAPDGEQIILQTPADWPRGFDVRGTLDEWKSNIAQHCRGNSLLLFAVAAAFAAKLIGPLRVENAGFHFRASSSQGKTTTVQVAATVDGDGAEKGGFVESWRATANGLEAVCERHNDSILPLDELAQCDPHVAGEAAYLIINGQGKGRMSRTITARRRANWRTILLSTGEISLATHVLQAGKRTRAGQEVRLLDIPVDEHSHGLFDDLHGFPTGRAFADHLKAGAGQYYGVAGREFVRALIAEFADFAKLQTAFDTFLKVDFLPKLPTSQASSEVFRAATKFALVAFGGECATAHQLTGWEAGEAAAAAMELFKAWLEARGSNGRADDDVIIRQIRLFVEQHGESRFRRLDRADERTINNRAGYFDGEVYYFSRESFCADVCKGYDPLLAARALERRGLLKANHGLQLKKHDPETGKTVSCYAVSAAILE